MLIMWQFNYEIADSSLDILINTGTGLKELIVGYKLIYQNRYQIISMDINKNENQMVFRHESYQLWESPCFGFLLRLNYAFINQALINPASYHRAGRPGS